MKEIKDIIRSYDDAQKRGLQSALATVVHVEGSSYRRAGGRMLVTEDGQLTGAISGGCLEGDALRKALLVMKQQKPMLVTYDTMDEDDAKLGVGLGCNGIIQVLIEPINSSALIHPIQFLNAAAEDRQIKVLVTIFSLENKKGIQYGTCLLVKDNMTIIGTVPVLNEVILADAEKTLLSQTSSFKNYISESHNIIAFIEIIKPPVSLIIIGAGNDVQPVVNMAAILGWETTVIDGRPNYAKQERFINACSLIVSKPEHALKQLNIDDQTAFVLMTHNYNYDMAILRQLVQNNVVYVGMLGPKKKLKRMLDEFEEEGIRLSGEQFSIIHSPAGLDIGAETSEEIALSILAEIKAIFAGRQGQLLKDKTGGIHEHSTSGIEEVHINEKTNG